MQHPVTSKHIDAISDLVVWAPIKPGFIDAFENITYETRLKLAAEALHKLRTTVREHELISPFPDSAERILSLLNFRIGIAEQGLFGFDSDERSSIRRARDVVPRRYMYLVATFDAPWEPYMRLIWKPLGPFLDLLLCNCEGYPLAQDTDFPAYARWVRDHQLDSGIFYSTTGLTVSDQIYLSQLEKLQRETLSGDAQDRAIAHTVADDPEQKATDILNSRDADTLQRVIRMAFEGLTVLYQLTNWFPPDKMAGEGRLLLHAAKELLLHWSPDPSNYPSPLKEVYEQLCKIYREPVAWFLTPLPPPSPLDPDPYLQKSEIQTGILSNFEDDTHTVTHGALALFTISDDADPNDVRRFLKLLADYEVTFDDGTPPHRGVFCNVAFTYKGLERLGLEDSDLKLFPEEFRLGMEERATLLGDVRENHPLEWSLPPRNWPDFLPAKDPLFPPVNLNEVHFAMQWRILNEVSLDGPRFEDLEQEITTSFKEIETAWFENRGTSIEPQLTNGPAKLISIPLPFEDLIEVLDGIVRNASDPKAEVAVRLAKEINRLGCLAAKCGINLAGYEPMFRPKITAPGSLPRDHFGFVDGISQPSIAPGTLPRDLVKTGDLIVGYANSRGDPAGAYRVEEPLFDYQYNGTFLVVRKIGQDREALDNFVCVTKAAYPDLDDDDITAALVGRSRDGKPLITAAGGGQNDFDYDHDRGGDQCPLASHIRRANPRVPFQGRPAPRILRRGMSYGPAYVSGENPQKPRGIMFMACCASIAEQYEVIQRWLNGGNSTRLPSAQNDPLTGISRDSQPRTFRFFSGDMARPDRLRRASIPHPSFTKLEWGAYFFFPAHAALRELAKATCETLAPVPNVKTGNQLIEELARLPETAREAEWKRLLEDFLSKDPAELAEGPDVWGAIRSTKEGGHHGIYRIPGPIAADFFDASASARGRKPCVFLVGSRRLVDKVFAGRAANGKIAFSSEEQYERLDTSSIVNYVAMDHGKTYRTEARATNQIVWDFSRYQADQAFLAGYGCGKEVLDGIKRTVASLPGPPKFKLDVGREFFMPALGLLTNTWFGIPDALSPAGAGEFELGEWGWKKPATTASPGTGERRPRCPGDFLATSRYAFYPRPGPEIVAKGIEHGEAIRAASLRLVEQWYRAGHYPGVLTTGMAGEIVQTGAQAELDLLARNVIGGMIGMLPPMNGALRGILHEWLKEKTLWQCQAQLRRARWRLNPGERWPSWRLVHDEIGESIARAMCRRPAPDLLYRTVVRKTRLGRYHLVPGDFLILGLVSTTQEELEQGKPDVLPIFGGERYAAIQPRGAPFHACPAREMSMAAIEGILAALLDSGQIKAQAASLIIEISGYRA